MSAVRAGVVIALTCLLAGSGCAQSSTSSPSASPTRGSGLLTPSPPPSVSAAPQTGSVVIVGRIVTMAEPAVAEALFIEDGSVAAIGTRDVVLGLAGADVAVMDIGRNVAYPGFVDAHAHWIGDRNYYGIETAAEAMDAAITRGWTSISEQWDDAEKLDELLDLAAHNELPLRVDSYLALNGVHPGEHYGDWYAERQPGPASDRLRVQGLKIHLDNGSGAIMLWEKDELTESIGRANEAGWQVSVHAVSTEAMEMVLDAFEATIGPTGPNPRHHRIEHALQVTDDQLARMIAMDLAVGAQLDGVATDWVLWAATADEDEYRRDYEAEELAWLGRWRDFVDAGLHVAGTSDAPWFFPDFELADDVGRPVDEIAGGMDGRGREFPEIRPWALDQLLTAEQGLRAVTVDAAHALRDESRRGHLAEGTLGDVTILTGDVTNATPDEIRAMDVIATIVGGVAVYCSSSEICSPLEN
jgi:predicted amidohydrolase YtcJ